MENQEVDLAKAMEFVKSEIAYAEAMQRLQNNPDFQLVFLEKYVRDWSLTQTANFASYSPETRKGYVEQLLARSVFSNFLEDIVDNGKVAKEAYPELQQDLNELGEG